MSITRQKLQQQFFEEYEKLNEQQRKAVDRIEGPVMVIAGPGTGKTQILSARVGKILLETDAEPFNILCLTYTDAGVIAMRKRLLSFIGPDAYKVNLYTFHAFCHDVVQENLSLFEKTSLDPVSDLEKLELFTQLIDSFPKQHPLKRYRGDAYHEIYNMRTLFSTMKQEGWTPEYINEKIDQYLEDLPNREQFIYKTSRPGKWDRGDLKPSYQEEIDRMEKLKAAVNEFEHFQELMRMKNRYDFDDMINWVVNAFEENKNLLARYQEQFLYILVDEYQDSSGSQNKLVELLISFWERPNVFVVGDDDQSIYRFQGANYENMQAFSETYKKDLFTVVLSNNYRSTQPILDISKSLIDRNSERLVEKMEGIKKNLISSNKKINHILHEPVVKEYESQRHEMIDITLQVEKLLEKDVPAGRIAVIYKENKYGEELANFFILRNIPVYNKRNFNILNIPVAQKIILFLKYLAAEHEIPFSGDEMLFEILHFEWFNIPAIEIAKLSVEVAEAQFTQNKTSLRRLMHEKSNAPAKDLFTPNIHKNLQLASKIIEKLISIVPNVTLQQLFEKLIREGGILNHILQSPDKIWLLQVLTGLFDFVKDETRRNPSITLHGLTKVFEQIKKEELVLPLVQVSGNEKGVNFLTAHGAKGLEFQYVFFAGCNSYLWEKKRKPGNGYHLPDTIFSSKHQYNECEELRRLFYVALTRAEEHLFISYCCYKNDGRQVEPTMFLAEILDDHELPVQKIFITEDILSEFHALQFGLEQFPEIEKMEEEFIERLLEKFVMNVTALSNYLKCPLEFYFRNLIRIPSPKNESSEFGSAVHYALERLFRKMTEDAGKPAAKKFPELHEFISDFEWYMHRHPESFTKEQFARRLEYGHEILTSYYNNYFNSWNKIVTIEHNIKNAVINGVPVKGKLDKLEFNGKNVTIVDYKTGDPDKGRVKLKPPNEKDPYGGDYWRQAVFYKILVEKSSRSWRVVGSEFDFVEPDKKKIYHKDKVMVTPFDVEMVTEQIVTVWQKIQNKDFYIGCGKEDCHWCQFVKTNNLAVALYELQEEEETQE